MMKKEVLLFDLDDTLRPDWDSLTEALINASNPYLSFDNIPHDEVCESLLASARSFWRTYPVYDWCMDIGVSSWEALVGTFDGNDATSVALRTIIPEYRQSTWRAFLLHWEAEVNLTDKLKDAFIFERREVRLLYDDVLEALDKLKEDYRLAILTNGHVGWQQTKVRESGIASYFEKVVATGYFGVGKPSPKVYQGTLDLLGVSASETTMIGNSLTKDVGGAQAIGIQGIWVNRNDADNSTEVVPDGEVSNLHEMVELVGSMS